MFSGTLTITQKAQVFLTAHHSDIGYTFADRGGEVRGAVIGNNDLVGDISAVFE